MEPTATLTRPAITDLVCDRCVAAAHVRATLPNGLDLLFCGHHGDQYGPDLLTREATFEPITRP